MADEFDEKIPGFDDGPLPAADEPAPRGDRGPLWDHKHGKWYWTPLPVAMLDSPAWRALPLNARAVFERIVIEFYKAPPGRRRNGQIIVTYDDFAAHGVRRKSIPAAIKRAQELGFIIVRRGGGGAGCKAAANRYGLTYLSWHEASHPSNDWEKHDDKGKEQQAHTKARRRRPKGEFKPKLAVVNGSKVLQ